MLPAFPIIDAHLDLAYLAQRGVDLTRPSPDEERYGVNLPAMRAGGVRLAFATIFTESVARGSGAGGVLEPWEYAGPEDVDGARRAAFAQLEIYRTLEERGEISIVETADDLAGLTAEIEGKGSSTTTSSVLPIPLVLMIEGADALRDGSDLAEFFDAGVRIIALSWARGSRHSGGNAMPGGLTASGRSLLDAMASRGVILDVSHFSDESFTEALDHFDGAVIASHSNARALLEPSQRHLRDDQAKCVAERGGVIGVNLFGRFLASGRKATMDDALRHLEHWRALVGAKHVGIGSDFDGGFTPLDCAEGLGRPEELPNLLEALRGAGWSDAEVRNVACESWLTLLRRSLPAAP